MVCQLAIDQGIIIIINLININNIMTQFYILGGIVLIVIILLGILAKKEK